MPPVNSLSQRAQRKRLSTLHGEERFDDARVQQELGFSKSGTAIVDRLLTPPLEYDLRTRAGKTIFYEGPLAVGELALVQRLLPKKDAVVTIESDAGVGLHAIELARTLPGTKTFAFEPVTENRAFLERNVNRAKLAARIDVLPQALGAEAGFLDLGGEAAEVVSLDAFVKERKLKAVDLVRIEAPGRELAIVAGARATLREHRPLVALNFSETEASLADAEQTIAEIVALGYRAYVALAGCAIPFTGYRSALRNYAFVDERRQVPYEELIDPASLLDAAASFVELSQRQAEAIAELERSSSDGAGGSTTLIAELRAANLQLEEALRQREADIALLANSGPQYNEDEPQAIIETQAAELQALRTIAGERESALEAVEEALRRLSG
jgi:hypothetical protein